MSDCWSTVPPKFGLEPDRLAACFLFRDRAIVPSNDVAVVFKPREAAADGAMAPGGAGLG
jgi:hypothetical protein